MKQPCKELWFQVMIAMVLGLAVGITLSASGIGFLSETAANHMTPWRALPGNLFQT